MTNLPASYFPERIKNVECNQKAQVRIFWRLCLRGVKYANRNHGETCNLLRSLRTNYTYFMKMLEFVLFCRFHLRHCFTRERFLQ